jgi:hypothetical protein
MKHLMFALVGLLSLVLITEQSFGGHHGGGNSGGHGGNGSHATPSGPNKHRAPGSPKPAAPSLVPAPGLFRAGCAVRLCPEALRGSRNRVGTAAGVARCGDAATSGTTGVLGSAASSRSLPSISTHPTKTGCEGRCPQDSFDQEMRPTNSPRDPKIAGAVVISAAPGPTATERAARSGRFGRPPR